MNREIFLEQFNDALFIEPCDAIGWNTLFREHSHWTSLASLMLISMFHSEYDLQLDPDEFTHCKTPEDLFRLVSEKTGALCTA